MKLWKMGWDEEDVEAINSGQEDSLPLSYAIYALDIGYDRLKENILVLDSVEN